MRHIANKASAIGLLAALLFAASAGTAQAQGGGVTIAPAALQLELTKGQTQVSRTFSITNHYAAPVNLHFAIEQSAQEPGKALPSGVILANADVTIPANGQAEQRVTLQDNNQVPPGSRLVDLVVSQQAAAGSGVGILPTLRLPVTLIKDDGAVASLQLIRTSTGGLAFVPPSSITTTVRNSGNILAIPHGVITIMAPNGTVVAHGVLNQASRAVLPGNSLKIDVPLTRLAAALLPGPYRIQIAYSLGGDTPIATSKQSFFLIAWWHVVAAGAIGCAGWYAACHFRQLLGKFTRKPKAKRPGPPKRQLLIGRDIT